MCCRCTLRYSAPFRTADDELEKPTLRRDGGGCTWAASTRHRICAKRPTAQRASPNAFRASKTQPCDAKVRQCSRSQPQAESSNSAHRRSSDELHTNKGCDGQHAARLLADATYQSFSCPPLPAAVSTSQANEQQGKLSPGGSNWQPGTQQMQQIV